MKKTAIPVVELTLLAIAVVLAVVGIVQHWAAVAYWSLVASFVAVCATLLSLWFQRLRRATLVAIAGVAGVLVLASAAYVLWLRPETEIFSPLIIAPFAVAAGVSALVCLLSPQRGVAA